MTNTAKKTRISKLETGDVVRYQGLECRILDIETYGGLWVKLTLGGLGAVSIIEQRFKTSQFLTRLAF